MFELKPCPFCGSSLATISDWSDEDGLQYWVHCQQCGCGTWMFPSVKEASAMWNRRAENT